MKEELAMLIVEKEVVCLKGREVYFKHHSKLISFNFILDSYTGYVLNLSEIKTAKKADPLIHLLNTMNANFNPKFKLDVDSVFFFCTVKMKIAGLGRW